MRKACEELGYDKEKWDTSVELPIDHKHWRDLSEAEKKAVETLGWEEEAWEHHYEHHEFSKLPELQKKAAESLGMDDEHKWKHWPHELHHKHWDDMTDEERTALAVLGWTKREWD